MSYIEVKDLYKEFKIPVNNSGVLGSIKFLFHPQYNTKIAVDNISFSIDRGEIVGYIGPNGAGKSTTIKMLSGILIPDGGSVLVNGLIPYKQRKTNAQHIGVVFGQRSQLYWDLPLLDSFELQKRIYKIDTEIYNKNKKYFIEILNMGDFVNQPVRQLSLGQKMKANLALSMLHNPDVLYLDEPTIGLDVISKRVLRESIKALNREMNTTIILTTHDMGDIEAICKHLILIDHGKKLFDGTLEKFKEIFGTQLVIQMTFTELPKWKNIDGYTLLKQMDKTWEIGIKNSNLSSKDVLLCLIQQYNPDNITIKTQNIEDIIQHIFSTSTGVYKD